MVPQVLATLHLLFSDGSRGRAFSIYGIVLGLAGAAGFVLGGVLVTSDIAGLGWRAVFFVNVPSGSSSSSAAACGSCRRCRVAPARGWMFPAPIVLFGGLLCLIGPLLFGHDVHWAPWLWLVMAAGSASLPDSCGSSACREPWRNAADRSCAVVGRSVHARALRGVLFLFRQPVVLPVMTMFMQRGAAYSAAAGRPGVRAVDAGLRRRLAAQRGAGAASRDAGADRGLRGSDSPASRSLVLTVASVDGAVSAVAGAGAGDFRLRPGAGDGAIVQRRAFHREAGQRRLGRRHVWHPRRSPMPPALRRSAPYFLRPKPPGRGGWRCSYRRRCLRCRFSPAPHFCHGCGARPPEAKKR
jgi:hypothetical protein